MRVQLIAIGRLKAGPERTLADRYATRFADAGRGCGLDAAATMEIAESAARRAPDRKAEEGRALLAVVPERARLIALDEGGAPWTSDAFAAHLGEAAASGVPLLTFAIGGADGLDASVMSRAMVTLSFGRLTLPHQLVRILLFEQLYRAASILIGHPYHRR